MRKSTPNRDPVKRQRAFKKALIDEGLTVTAFARRHDVTVQHVARAFSNPPAVGQWLHAAIDALIEKHRTNAAA